MRKPWNMEAKNEVMVLLLALETSWINPLVTCFSPFWVSSFTHSSYHYMAYYWYDYLTAAWLCLHLHSGSACETEPSLMMRLKGALDNKLNRKMHCSPFMLSVFDRFFRCSFVTHYWNSVLVDVTIVISVVPSLGDLP